MLWAFIHAWCPPIQGPKLMALGQYLSIPLCIFQTRTVHFASHGICIAIRLCLAAFHVLWRRLLLLFSDSTLKAWT